MINTCRTFSGLVRKESQKEINARVRLCAEGEALNQMRAALRKCAEMGVLVRQKFDKHDVCLVPEILTFEMVNLNKYKAYVIRRVQQNKENQP